MSDKRSLITSSVASEIMVDRPINAVWKCVFEFPEWAPTIQKAELLEGEWDKEGCLMLLTKKDWVGLQPFYSEYIACTPFRRQVYRNWTKDGDQLDGFVELLFSEVGAGTKVVYSNYLLFRVEASSKNFAGPQGAILGRSDFQNGKAAQQMVDIYLRPLKEFAESKPK